MTGWYKKTGYRLLAATFAFMAAACDKPEDAAVVDMQDDMAEVVVLSYEEQESGTGSYPVRVLVSPEFLRMDDGYAASDFVLLDRREKIISSVSHTDRSVMVIRNQPADAGLPENIALRVVREADEEAPAIAGKRPEQIKYLANDELCFQSVTVPGLLQDAVSAMGEYAVILANRQSNNMQSVPLNMRTPCFLSRYVYAPARQFQYGLPVQEWDDSGYSRTLVNFSDREMRPLSLFELPVGYDSFSPGQ